MGFLNVNVLSDYHSGFLNEIATHKILSMGRCFGTNTPLSVTAHISVTLWDFPIHCKNKKTTKMKPKPGLLTNWNSMRRAKLTLTHTLRQQDRSWKALFISYWCSSDKREFEKKNFPPLLSRALHIRPFLWTAELLPWHYGQQFWSLL